MICKKERKKSLFLMICTQASCVMICHYSVMDKKSRINMIRLFWWGEMDSNHRSRWQQIYSLPPLATREPPHIYWSWRLESNPQPADYKSAALPIELRQRVSGIKMVPRGGIEPPTRGFSVPCSTYWATEASTPPYRGVMATWKGLEPSTSSVTG